MKLCVNGHLVDDFKEKRAWVAAVKNGKCGYINANGHEVVAFLIISTEILLEKYIKVRFYEKVS